MWLKLQPWPLTLFCCALLHYPTQVLAPLRIHLVIPAMIVGLNKLCVLGRVVSCAMSVPPLATGFPFPASVHLSKLGALRIWVPMEVKPLQRLQQPVAPDFLGTLSPRED